MPLSVKLKDTPKNIRKDLKSLEQFAKMEISFAELKRAIEQNNEVRLTDEDVESLIKLGYK